MNVKQILLLTCLSALFFSANTIAKPQRVVSLNLCADQLLMALLEPEQLVGITQLASDPGASYLYETAAQFHQHNDRIEEVMALKPDLVVAGAFTAQPTNQLLEELGYKVITLGLPVTIDGIIQQITFLGDELGQQQRAKKLIKTLQDELAELAQGRKNVPPLRAVVYYANGYSAGKQTIVDEILKQAGLANIAAELNLDYIAPLSLESLLKSHPDILLLGELGDNTDSLAHQILRHDALDRYAALKEVRKIMIPDRYWSCAGPSSIAAASYLQQKVFH
ncbi:MAG: cobalamin/Fe3+-siderophore ABC transporter substrate-binding protein [Cycloclasticus sp.]|nr:MAG: cobalamin/Fe3+-siderophore ABC transporter substrate-binding protein [Cycloclasticus sp.]